MITLAQTATRDTPMRTVIQQNRERGVEPWARRELPWGLLGVLALLAVAAALTAWRIQRRGRRAKPPRERAFLTMSRKLGLDEPARKLVRDLAAEARVEPLTLLVSPETLRATLTRIDRERWRTRRGWKRVVSLADAA